VLVRNEEVLLRVSEDNNILHAIEIMEANWIGHTLRRSCPPKHVIEGNIEVRVGEDEEEDLSSYWEYLKERQGTEDIKRKQYMALCGELSLEEAMDLV
jgi:hypothetical protein